MLSAFLISTQPTHLDERGPLLALHLAKVGLRKARVGEAGDAPAGSGEAAAARAFAIRHVAGTPALVRRVQGRHGDAGTSPCNSAHDAGFGLRRLSAHQEANWEPVRKRTSRRFHAPKPGMGRGWMGA